MEKIIFDRKEVSMDKSKKTYIKKYIPRFDYLYPIFNNNEIGFEISLKKEKFPTVLFDIDRIVITEKINAIQPAIVKATLKTFTIQKLNWLDQDLAKKILVKSLTKKLDNFLLSNLLRVCD